MLEARAEPEGIGLGKKYRARRGDGTRMRDDGHQRHAIGQRLPARVEVEPGADARRQSSGTTTRALPAGGERGKLVLGDQRSGMRRSGGRREGVE
jgi:hypothetical protein